MKKLFVCLTFFLFTGVYTTAVKAEEERPIYTDIDVTACEAVYGEWNEENQICYGSLASADEQTDSEEAEIPDIEIKEDEPVIDEGENTEEIEKTEDVEENNVSSKEATETVKPQVQQSVQTVETSTVQNYITYKMTRATEAQIERYTKPNFKNMDAYGWMNPYTADWLGQCTWFTWGRFYEIYGYSPCFTGNGCDCVIQLVLAHPDKWEFATKPVVGSVFSADYAHNHVGIIVGIEKDEFGNDLYIVQEGNLNGRNDSWDEVETDCWTQTYTMEELKNIYGNVTFANPKDTPNIHLLRTDVKETKDSKTSKKSVKSDKLKTKKVIIKKYR